MKLIGLVLMTAGLLFAFVGVIGLFRFPDTYTRLKALALVNLPAAVCIHVASSLLVEGGGQRGYVTAILFILSGPVLAHVILIAARDLKIAGRGEFNDASYRDPIAPLPSDVR